ncbi:Ku protein [Planctomicrobium sp. SH664]|uniref:non-homologous end joining protein Ku n=1 Tax=Planctomicrobium sp. SH664 TaxID=3448125 RepID=UPI003F5BBC5F
MGRPVWSGQISFGLVNIPVAIHGAERRSDLSFKLIDSRNSARVRYERVNEETGKEVPWSSIVKGFEYDKGSYVLLTEKDLESAAVEMTKTIEIETFVDPEEIESVYFDRPYFIIPGKGAEKGYVLLREAMEKSGRVGIAKVVIRTRQYLSAVIPDGNALLLELLRFPQEVVSASEFNFPGRDLKKLKISPKEIDLARQLIEGMSSPWNPDDYHDEYRSALMEMIDRRIKAGKTELIEDEEEPEEQARTPRTINFMDVLKQSVEKTTPRKKKKAAAKRRPAKRKRVS